MATPDSERPLFIFCRAFKVKGSFVPAGFNPKVPLPGWPHFPGMVNQMYTCICTDVLGALHGAWGNLLRGVIECYKAVLRRSRSSMLSRLLISAARRLPFRLPKWYVPALGQMLYRAEDASSTFGEIFLHRIYEPIAPLPENPTVVDLGSSLGLFVIFMNQRIRGGTIMSFEASPKTFAYLKQNVAAIPGKHGNRIEIHNVAISDHAGHIDFLIDSRNETNVAATAYRDISRFPDAANFVPTRVPCARLDQFVRSRIDYLKCDVEGAEYLVLEDELLDPSRIGQMTVEFHDVDKHMAEFRRIVQTCFTRGYRAFDDENTELVSIDAVEEVLHRAGGDSVIVKFCGSPARGRWSRSD